MSSQPAAGGGPETVALLQDTLDATHDGILVVDRVNGVPTVVLYNRRYLEMFRFDTADIARGGIDWVAAQLVEQLDNPDVLLRRDGHSRIEPWSDHGREVLRFKDGRVFERYSAPRTEGGRVVGRVLSYRDVTDTVLAQASLEKHREFLETAQEAGHIGSWVYELDGSDRLGWSNETLRIFGLAATSFSGHVDDFQALVHEDDREVVEAAFRRALDHGESYDVEHRVVRPDGAVRWVHERAEIVRDATGNPVRAIGTVQDVTDRRQLEQQLRQSQKLEAIGRLAGGVAHDLNNALTAIAGYTELALGQLDPDHPARPDVEEIRSATQRAEAVTRQLLAFSRRQMLEPRVFSLADAVRSLHRFLERLLGASVQVEIDAPEGLPPVYGDPGQIEQAILNLAINARDAMPGGGRLSVAVALVEVDDALARAKQPMKPGPYLRLTVRDTGHGMTPDIQSRIFEPFFTTKDVGKGTGLGLSMVYGTVKQSGGYIFVDSAPGQGAEFRIYVPPAPGGRAPRVESGSAPTADSALTHATVLVVEDERPVRTMVATTLRNTGLQVLQASTADEALRVLATAHPPVDLVLTDATMPGTSGVELARRLAKDQPSLPVIIMSGFTEEALGDLRHRVSLLAKPFTPGEVQARVTELLSRRR
jgi:PAS domain S-box-containing protein